MPHFFGLGPEDRENILEQVYLLMKVMRISYEALRAMPVSYRTWFIKRHIKEINLLKEKDQYGLDDDTPISALQRNR